MVEDLFLKTRGWKKYTDSPKKAGILNPKPVDTLNNKSFVRTNINSVLF